MQNVKMPTSRSYRDFLRESLQDPEEAASYIEGVLETGENDPKLFSKVLRTVVEAYTQDNKLSKSAQVLYENLETMIREKGCTEIMTFVNLLNELGLQLAVKVKSEIDP